MKRLFWILAMATTTFLALSQPQKTKDSSMKFPLKPLPYSYTALEPWLDATTLTLHHDKHQATYVNNLNNALAKYPDYHFRDKLCEILCEIFGCRPQEYAPSNLACLSPSFSRKNAINR